VLRTVTDERKYDHTASYIIGIMIYTSVFQWLQLDIYNAKLFITLQETPATNTSHAISHGALILFIRQHNRYPACETTLGTRSLTRQDSKPDLADTAAIKSKIHLRNWKQKKVTKNACQKDTDMWKIVKLKARCKRQSWLETTRQIFPILHDLL